MRAFTKFLATLTYTSLVLIGTILVSILMPFLMVLFAIRAVLESGLRRMQGRVAGVFKASATA